METPRQHRPHPWHGISPGPDFPRELTAYVEIVPTDGVKYEVDKHSGYLKIDRPQRFSSFCPTLYGFVPQTYCDVGVAGLQIPGGPVVTQGDRDPLDICVLTDRPVLRGDILLVARPVGGLRMVEGDEADDKIIAVLKGDPAYGEMQNITDLPEAIVDRLRHYFLTYKSVPGTTGPKITVDPVYDVAMAHAVLEASRQDYEKHFGKPSA